MKFEELVKEILEYESDTFSARGNELKKATAKKMAESLIDYLVSNHLDGVLLSEIYEEVTQ